MADTTPEGDFGTDDETTWSANETLKTNAIDDITVVPAPVAADAYKWFTAKKANSILEALRKATRWFEGTDVFGDATTWLRLRGGIALGDTAGAGPRVLAITTYPETNVTAPPGTIALRTNGAAYLKETGTGNTGWAELQAGAVAAVEKWSTYHNFNQTSIAENYVPINDLAEATGDDYYHRMLTRGVDSKIVNVCLEPSAIGCGDTVVRVYEYDRPSSSAVATLLKTSATIDIDGAGPFDFDFSSDPPLFSANELGGISIDTTGDGPDQTCLRIDWEAQA